MGSAGYSARLAGTFRRLARQTPLEMSGMLEVDAVRRS